MKKIKTAIIGMGVMGNMFSKIIKEVPYSSLVAISDLNENLLLKCKKELNVAVYKDYNEMFAKEDLDCVLICTPDRLHFDPVSKAIKKNLHIFLEKPLTTDVDEGKKILDISKQHNKVFMVGHTLRYDPRFVQGYDSIKRGDIGDIIHIRSWRETSIINGLRLKNVTNPMFFLGIHDIDIILWYTNSKVKRVYAEGVRKKLKNVEDSIFALLKFEDGIIASLETSWVLPKTQTQQRSNFKDKGIEIVGTKGMLSIDASNIGITVQNEDEIFYPEILYNVPVHNSTFGIYKEEILHYYKCILNNESPATNVKDALMAVEIAVAIDKSLKENKIVIL